jgi:hypothetical protein
VTPAVRRPHALTKAYIRAWSDDHGTLEVIDIQRNQGLRTSINNATVVRGAYETLVLNYNLEAEYSRIESVGIRVIAKLRGQPAELSSAEMQAMINFLDMHLDRGRYADQVGALIPAVLLKVGGVVETVEFNAADRLRLSQSLPDVLRLANLGLDKWEWRVQPWPHNIVTGDGAVLLFQESPSADVCTVAFPLSPSLLLVIGKQLQVPIAINDLIAARSRRWLISSLGTLKMGELG